MHRDHEIWRVKARKGGIIVCAIYERGETVGVRTTLADGTLLRIQETSDLAAARVIAAQWLDAIRDLLLTEEIPAPHAP